MRKNNLLYIGNKLSAKGKTTTSVDRLSKLLEDQGWTVYSASSKNNKLWRLADMILTVLRYGRRCEFLLIDTYSTQNFYYAVIVAMLGRFMNLKYIPILHGGNLPHRLKNNPRYSSKLFKGAYINVAPSRYLIERFSESGYDNLEYIPNSIELSDYTYKQRLELRPRILWVRSFSKIYNPELAVEVLRRLDKKGIKAELCMVGPDKDGSKAVCEKFAQKNHLNLKTTGMLPKAEWLKLSEGYDIFINTTNFDNTPVSVIEAMALGLPIVSTNVGGMPYLIDDNKDGILVPPDDAEVFVDAILDLLADIDLVKTLTSNARKKVEGFAWTVVRDQWNDLLKGINN